MQPSELVFLCVCTVLFLFLFLLLILLGKFAIFVLHRDMSDDSDEEMEVEGGPAMTATSTQLTRMASKPPKHDLMIEEVGAD